MTSIEGRVGIQQAQDGASTTVRMERTGGLVKSDAHGRYNEAVRIGNVYTLTAANATPTAYVGAGNTGVPFIAIYNPVGSGKNCVLLQAGIASRTTPTTSTVLTGFDIWGGVSAATTGTRVVATNMYTLQTSGSITYGVVNTATTGSTSLSLVMPLGTHYWATAASGILNPLWVDIAGSIICPPGCMVALGATIVITTATYDATLMWEEVPI